MKKTLIGIAVVAAALSAQATVYRAGLKGGFINSYDGNNYTTVTIPDTGVFASADPQHNAFQVRWCEGE